MTYDDYNRMMARWQTNGQKMHEFPQGSFALLAKGATFDKHHQQVGVFNEERLYAYEKAAAENPWRGQLASHKAVSSKPIHRMKNLMEQGKAQQNLVRQTKAKMSQSKDKADMRKKAFLEGYMGIIKAAQSGTVLGSQNMLNPNLSPAQVRQPDQAVPTPPAYNNQISGAAPTLSGTQQSKQDTGGQIQLYQGLNATSGSPQAKSPSTGFSAPSGRGSAY